MSKNAIFYNKIPKIADRQSLRRLGTLSHYLKCVTFPLNISGFCICLAFFGTDKDYILFEFHVFVFNFKTKTIPTNVSINTFNRLLKYTIIKLDLLQIIT